MIFTWIITIFLNLIEILLSWLPDGGFPSDVLTGANNFYNSVYAYNSIFPIDTMFTLLHYTVYFWLAVWIWDIIKYFTKLTRGHG